MKRKSTPLHNFWYPRINGQIIDCMKNHPEYFAKMSKAQKLACINSLSKRIVGEIVAVYQIATNKRR